MAHFAKVLNGKVIDVIVAEPEFFDTFRDSSPGEWIQTSYNTTAGKHLKGGTPLRANYAGIGYNYDKEEDVFYEPKPYNSWILDKETYTWHAPVPMPEDVPSLWDESTLSWKVAE